MSLPVTDLSSITWQPHENLKAGGGGSTGRGREGVGGVGGARLVRADAQGSDKPSELR